MSELTSNEGSATTDGDALPNRDPPDVTRFKTAAAKRAEAHRARARMGLRCLTVRVSDRTVRHLISTGYLALESREAPAYVAFALEAWIYDSVPEQAGWRSLCPGGLAGGRREVHVTSTRRCPSLRGK